MKPTFVLVCGGGHTTAYLDPLIRVLSDAGYASVAVTPRCLNSSPPATSFQPDVEAVKEVITDLVEKGSDVIVVMHSYGGAVGTEAVGDLVDSTPGYADKIKRLVHLTTMYPVEGQMIGDSVAGLVPMFLDTDVGFRSTRPKSSPGALAHG
ncbi:alpha/beta fold hydrolase [Candidatus Bathyarchaeota archaeon]|nr:alpha/beta fold hydrolase [Candidatus Bathyarchaeota archaeon]